MHKSVRHATAAAGIDAVSITSDRSFPRHSHDEFGLGFMVDGGQESWSGRGLVEARAGDVITVNPGELHDGLAHPGQARSWKIIYFSPDVAARHDCQDFQSLEFTQPVIAGSRANAVVASAIGTAMSPDADLEQIEEALTLAFGALRGQFVSAGVQQCLSPSVRHVLERIQDDISDPASLDTLAEGAGLSRFQTLRLFAKEVGATPHAYLTQLRINAVKRMIVAGTPLAEASVACGFADQSHMTRAFQRQYGITPGKYRRRSQI